MTHEQFCYWLQGVLDGLNGACPDGRQCEVIQRRLSAIITAAPKPVLKANKNPPAIIEEVPGRVFPPFDSGMLRAGDQYIVSSSATTTTDADLKDAPF